MQTQGTIAKDFSCPKKLKMKDPKSVSLCDNTTKPAKKKNKQKRFKCRQKNVLKNQKKS